MEYLVGVGLASGLSLLLLATGMYRERALYPAMAIVVASYYGLFAAIGGEPAAVLPELIGIAAFVLLAVIGYRTNLWIVVVAIAGHGLFDGLHPHVIADPGVPAWWPGFCLGFDVFAGAWLAWLLATSRVEAQPRHFADLIRPYVNEELLFASKAADRQDFAGAFTHLERAHVLGQRCTREHVRVHWHMLLWAVRQRHLQELSGQLQRILGAALLTALGLVPEGNTGGARMSAFRRLPIQAELARIIARASARPLP